MGAIWETLGIQETRDIRAIRKAYAAMAAKYNPEEYPDEFLRIREAYDKALAIARTAENGERGINAVELSEAEQDGEDVETSHDGSFRWDFAQENPFVDGPAICRFRELYLGKRNRDRAAWYDYFTSEGFLEGYRERDFVFLMLDEVRRNLAACPPTREFLTELYIAYGLTDVRRGSNDKQVQVEGGAAFDGIEQIVELAQLGTGIMRFKGNDEAMKAGFRDYRMLLKLFSGDHGEEEQVLELGGILDRYVLANISDSPMLYADQYELSQRHPKSLRLIRYFFEHVELPERAYTVAWKHLHLENALYGREKLLYGEVREAVLRRAPGLAEKPRLNYQQISKDFEEYQTRCCDLGTTQMQEETEQLFARESFQCALLDEWFVERMLLRRHISKSANRYYIDDLETFYRAHPKAPFVERVLTKIEEWREQNRIRLELEEDETEALTPGCFDFTRRAYVRYYLNTAFHHARGQRNSTVFLQTYLTERLPVSLAWNRRLLDPEEGGFSSDRTVSIYFDDQVLNVIFHLRYIEYQWDGEAYGPSYPWELLTEADDALFWLLLPITEAPIVQHTAVYEELQQRLSRLPLHPADVPVIADCITGTVCRFAQDAGSGQVIFTLYREKEERLFGCDIYRNGEIRLYEEVSQKDLLLPGQYYAPDMETAIRMSQRLLEELTASHSISTLMECMPDRLFMEYPGRRAFSTPEGEQVTEEMLREQLELYLKGEAFRVELAWGSSRSLVFINSQNYKQPAQYACLYFDHQASIWYALVSLPEIYATVQQDQVVYKAFRRGWLPDYLLFENPDLMRSRLNDILRQIGQESVKLQGIMWSSHVYRTMIKLRYHRDMRLYGNFPLERARNQLSDRFDISELPVRLSYTDMEGQRNEAEVGRNTQLVQECLIRYMMEQLAKLSLFWQLVKTDKDGAVTVADFALILRQDEGKHQMLYLNRAEGFGEWFVGDPQEYMKAEGNKYRKCTFLGKIVPGYLVHTNLCRIRDVLDLLFPAIRNPEPVLNEFGEFAYDSAPEVDLD